MNIYRNSRVFISHICILFMSVLFSGFANSTENNASLIKMSQMALENGDPGSAIEHIEKALALEPTNADEIVLSGDIYCNKAQNSSMFSALKFAKKCIAQYETAVNLEPENIKALVSAVRFHMEAPSIAGGSEEKGKLFLERLTVLSPEDADTCRIQLFLRQDNINAALELAETLSEKGFNSARNQYDVAHFYRNSERYDKAAALFEPLTVWPETPENKWHVTDSLLQLGEILLINNSNVSKSIELIEKYKEKNTNPRDVHYFWSTWSLAKAYRAAGNSEKYTILVKKIKSENYKENKPFAKRFKAEQ